MTPAEISAITTAIGLLQNFSAWKVGSILAFSVIGPDILCIVFMLYVVTEAKKERAEFRANMAEMRRQFERAIDQYNNNVLLVKQVASIAEGLQDVVILNTQVMQGMKTSIDNNLFCPVMKKHPRVEVPA